MNLFLVTIDAYRLENIKIEVYRVSGGGGTHGGFWDPRQVLELGIHTEVLNLNHFRASGFFDLTHKKRVISWKTNFSNLFISFNFQVRLMRFTALELSSSALQISSGSFAEIRKFRIPKLEK